MDWIKRKKSKSKEKAELTESLETPAETRLRQCSLKIIYFTMFMMSLGFSIIITGVWPYLVQLDKDANKTFLGLVVAANPLGQMIFSPLVGLWGNRLVTIRIPCLVCIAMFMLGSGWYSMLEMFSHYRRYWMIAARFIVGVSSASVAVCRSYLSAATTIRERTQAISMVSLAQVIGFVIGPAIQAALTPLGEEGWSPIPGVLTFNMYTVAGWINVALGIINFVFFLPFMFQEQRIAAKEAMKKQGKLSEEETWKGISPDYVATWTLIATFFTIVFNFVLLETLGTPLVMDQFGWNESEAINYMGILMSVGAVVACFTFIAIGPLSKRFDERKVLLYGGLIPMLIGRALYIPWGNEYPPIASVIQVGGNWTSDDFNGTMENYLNSTMISDFNETMINATMLNGTEIVTLGCPATQKWCYYTPVMTVTQLLVGYAFTSVGYPIAVTLTQTIFSKILGPRPQGLWMGWMTGSGCFSRVLGPVFVSYIYSNYGTVWTFGLTTAQMAVAILWLLIVYKRLSPQDAPVENGTSTPQPVPTEEIPIEFETVI